VEAVLQDGRVVSGRLPSPSEVTDDGGRAPARVGAGAGPERLDAPGLRRPTPS
jgi:hypothetical protein